MNALAQTKDDPYGNELRQFKLQHRMLSIQEQNAQMDKFSEISGLRSEVDEWAALNKYAVY